MSLSKNSRLGSVLEAKAPTFSAAGAEKIAKKVFDVVASADAMVSERDQNFRLHVDDGRELVLKIANPAEDPAVIEFQTEALLHIAQVDPSLAVPHVVPSPSGAVSHEIEGPDGARHIVRLLSYLSGQILDHAQPNSQLLRDVGATAARLGRALRGFFHPAARHDLLWDLTQAPGLRERTSQIEGPARRDQIDGLLVRFEDRVIPVLRSLRAQVIHNDVSCNNTLVEEDRVVGVIDFGDLIHAPLVCDIAVPVSELIVEASDPVDVAMEIVAGYHGVEPFTAEELRVVFDITIMRLAMAVTISAWRSGSHPENIEYITAGVDAYWGLLDRLAECGPEFFYASLRRACGMPRSV